MGIAKEVSWSREIIKKHIALCALYSGLAATACWREISHMFLYSENNDLEKVKKLCQQAEVIEDQKECYLHAFKIVNLTNPEMF